jgi:CTP-dependent riboflavin kinase
VGVRIDADEIRTTGRRTDITLVPARLRGERVFLLRPQVPVHDPEVLEVLAPLSLRQRFELHDGDEIEIEVDPDVERAAGD